MGTLINVKEVFKPDKVHEAFFTGGNVAWTKDGQELLCQCTAVVKVLNVETGKVTTTVPKLSEEEAANEEDADTILTFTLSEDDKFIVTAHKSSLLKLWNWKEEKLEKVWKSIHKGPVIKLAFNSDGSVLASGGSDTSIKIWNMKFQSCTNSLKGLQGVTSVLCFYDSPSGAKKVIGAADDPEIHIWDLGFDDSVVNLKGHFSKVTGVVVCKETNQLISCSRDKVMIVWDLKSYTQILTIPVYESLEALLLLPKKLMLQDSKKSSGVHIGYGGEKGLFKVRNVSKNTEVFSDSKETATPISQLLFNQATDMVAVVSADQNITLRKIGESFETYKQYVGFCDEILDVAFIGNDSHIVVATNSPDVKVYNVETFHCQLMHGHTDTVLTVCATTANRNLFASSSKDKSVRVWYMFSSENIQCVCVGSRHTDSVSTIALSRLPKSKDVFLVSAGVDMCIKVWSLPRKFKPEDDQQILNVKLTELAHQKEINSVSISPNDKIIASASQDKTAKLWSADKLSLIGVLKGHRRGIWHVCFSTDDQVVATSSADATIKLWAISDLSCVKTLESHDSSVMKCIFINRGTQIASIGGDGLLKLWLVKSGECIGTFDKHSSKIWALAAKEDGEQLLTGGSDSRLVEWNDHTEEAKREAAERLHEKIAQEQQLANLIQSNHLLPALQLALSLERPLQVLKIIEKVFPKGKDHLQSTVEMLTDDEKLSLLKCAVAWNTNSKNAYAAQLIISILLDEVGKEKLALPQSTLEGLLPYTERHFKRIDQLTMQLNLLQYTINLMQPHAKEEP
nr:PREDICTED: transducin beta-like protein 3 [Bemisia tabaci]